MEIKECNCGFDPEPVEVPKGMFKCPECGEYVMPGLKHPDYSISIESEDKEDS